MVDSIILRTTARVIVPLMLLFSIFVFLRGHNESGGGFIGGLLVVGSIVFYAVSHGVREAAEAIRVNPRDLIGVGIMCAVVAGIIPLFAGDTFLTGKWLDIPLPGGDYYALGTSLLFDLGVYLAVAGTGIGIVFSFESRGITMFPD